MTTTTNPASTWDVPAIHVYQPGDVPTSAEVKAALDPNDRLASDITDLATVLSGEIEVRLVRYDWPDLDPELGIKLAVRYDSKAEQIVWIDSESEGGPMQAWQRLTELANAASVAAQQLLTMVAAGSWK
jgi:hypothetical protein